MADENRTPPHPLKLLEELEKTAYAYDFYQALRRLDCSFPDKPPTGQSSRAADDPVRISQEVSMAFAPATLQAVEPRGDLPPRLVQRFFGMLGPQGPLPLHITEYVRDRLRNHDDKTLLRFLDVFHHRMITLFYRAWARVRPTVSFDQPAWDRFSDYTGTLFGLGMATLLNRDALPDLPKRHFAGLMSCQTRHAEGLLAILKGYFRLPVQVEEFVGQWVELPANCRCLLGLSSAKLGVDTTVGSHVWDCQQKFRVVLGPLALDEYYRMLPGKSQLLPDELDETSDASDEPNSALGEPSDEPVEAAEPSANGQPTSGASLSESGSGLRSPLPTPMRDRERSLATQGHSPPSLHDQPTLTESHLQPEDGFSSENVGPLHSVPALQEDDAVVDPSLAEPSAGKQTFADPFGEEALAEVLDELVMQGTALGFRRADDDDGDGGAWPGAGQLDSAADHPVEASAEKSIGDSQRPGSSAARQAAAPGGQQWRGAAARSASKRGISLDRMISAVRAYVGDELQWDLQLILKKEDTPPIGLGIVGNLGWSSWVIRDNMLYDPNDLVLDAMGTPPETQLIEYRHVRAWDHKTLGQRRSGQYIVATIDMGDLSAVQAALSS
jgi:type VI secretion system protein ImpH